MERGCQLRVEVLVCLVLFCRSGEKFTQIFALVGGFTVLAALCAGKVFGAGTSLYGVSDLALLASDTHKVCGIHSSSRQCRRY